MSTSLEFNRHVISTNPVGRYKEPQFFGYCETGSSNVISHRNTIVRNNHLMLIKQDTDFMREIVSISASCEGGMLKMNGRYTKPESYIAAWRKAMKQALPIQYYLRHTTMDIEFYSMVRQLQDKQSKMDLSTSWDRERHSIINDLIIELCMTEYVNETRSVKFYGKTVAITRFQITKENVDSALDLLSRLFDHGVSDRAIWKSSFNSYAWSRGQYQQKFELQNPEKDKAA